jgi:hypothetical protein
MSSPKHQPSSPRKKTDREVGMTSESAQSMLYFLGEAYLKVGLPG